MHRSLGSGFAVTGGGGELFACRHSCTYRQAFPRVMQESLLASFPHMENEHLDHAFPNAGFIVFNNHLFISSSYREVYKEVFNVLNKINPGHPCDEIAIGLTAALMGLPLKIVPIAYNHSVAWWAWCPDIKNIHFNHTKPWRIAESMSEATYGQENINLITYFAAANLYRAFLDTLPFHNKIMQTSSYEVALSMLHCGRLEASLLKELKGMCSAVAKNLDMAQFWRVLLLGAHLEPRLVPVADLTNQYLQFPLPGHPQCHYEIFRSITSLSLLTVSFDIESAELLGRFSDWLEQLAKMIGYEWRSTAVRLSIYKAVPICDAINELNFLCRLTYDKATQLLYEDKQ